MAACLPRLFPTSALVIMATAFAVITPFLFFGNTSGHDFEFHLNSWMEVLGQWRQGILYPRWAALAHYGYGEPRFLFYPPASWMLGAALGAVLPWKMVPGAYVWLALTAAGLSMFRLARRWLDSRQALLAAALYAANPYHIVIVYWRSAFAELLASALLPLLLLFVLRAETEGRKIIVPLGLIVAAAWLTNAPVAVMVNYSLALLVVVVAVLQRSPRVLLYGAAAVLLGAALAAFYVVPAAYEEKWVNIAEVLAPGVRPQDNFLFTTVSDPEHTVFNLLVSIVASAEIMILTIAGLISDRLHRRQRALWWALVTWAAAGTLLLFPVSFRAWQYLPKLRFVQLPWRWLLCFNVAFAVLVTAGIRRSAHRIGLCAALLAVLLAAGHSLRPPWWDTAADIAKIHDALQGARGYQGTDEYVPAGADPYEVKQNARKVAIEDGGHTQVHIREWAPENKFFTLKVSRPTRLTLRLFNYPAWKVEVNERAVAAESDEVTGQMIVPVPSGEGRVRLTFTRTWDRTAGGVISGLTATFLLCLMTILRMRRGRSAARCTVPAGLL